MCCALSALLLVVSVVSASKARAEWPERAITFMVQFGPGGITDLVVRVLAKELSKSLGQPIIVFNRPGAQGALMASELARAQPDGYTLGMLSSGLPLQQLVVTNPPTVKDFTVIANVGRAVFVVAVNAASPYKSIDDLVAASKVKKGGINFGGPSSINTLGMLLLAEKTGLQFQPISYRSGSETTIGLLTDQIDVALPNPSDVTSFIEDGKVRVLAVAERVRLKSMPDVPTLRELGYDVVIDAARIGVGAPANLPEPIRQRLEAKILKIANDPAFQEQLRNSYGLETEPMPGEQYRAVIGDVQETVAKFKSLFPSSR